MNKNIIKITSAILLSLSIASCQKNGFLDSNNDPNRVTDQNVTPELIFPSAANNIGSRTNSGDLNFLQRWVGYYSSNADYVPLGDEISYNITFTFTDGIFQSRYNALYNLHQVETKGLASGDTAIAAAAMILSTKTYQELIDMFGDIPYSQAFQTDKYPHPAYDKGKDIYDSLQKKLDKAIGYFKLPVRASFSSVDIVNHGDAGKWTRLANTIKLRLLIRQSETSGFNPSTEINKILSNGGVLLAGDNVTVNPGYVNDNNKQNPYYAAYGYDILGNRANLSNNANTYIINILNNNKDPRISRFFTPVSSNYIGNRYGDLITNQNTSANSSYFGPGLVGSASQDQPIYLGFQSLFLRAEAAARGWLPGVDPKAAYMAAVTESFVYIGVPNPQAAASTYMTNNASADYSNSGSTALSQAKFIAYQKYIANTGLDPLESYSDQRRLSFLTDNSYISISSARVSSILPFRLPYPQSEYTTNGDQVNKEGTINIFSNKIFWEP